LVFESLVVRKQKDVLSAPDPLDESTVPVNGERRKGIMKKHLRQILLLGLFIGCLVSSATAGYYEVIITFTPADTGPATGFTSGFAHYEGSWHAGPGAYASAVIEADSVYPGTASVSATSSGSKTIQYIWHYELPCENDKPTEVTLSFSGTCTAYAYAYAQHMDLPPPFGKIYSSADGHGDSSGAAPENGNMDATANAAAPPPGMDQGAQTQTDTDTFSSSVTFKGNWIGTLIASAAASGATTNYAVTEAEAESSVN